MSGRMQVEVDEELGAELRAEVLFDDREFRLEVLLMIEERGKVKVQVWIDRVAVAKNDHLTCYELSKLSFLNKEGLTLNQAYVIQLSFIEFEEHYQVSDVRGLKLILNCSRTKMKQLLQSRAPFYDSERIFGLFQACSTASTNQSAKVNSKSFDPLKFPMHTPNNYTPPPPPPLQQPPQQPTSHLPPRQTILFNLCCLLSHFI